MGPLLCLASVLPHRPYSAVVVEWKGAEPGPVVIRLGDAPSPDSLSEEGGGRSWDPCCVSHSTDEDCFAEGRFPYLCHRLFIFLLHVNTLKGPQEAGRDPTRREVGGPGLRQTESGAASQGGPVPVPDGSPPRCKALNDKQISQPQAGSHIWMINVSLDRGAC